MILKEECDLQTVAYEEVKSTFERRIGILSRRQRIVTLLLFLFASTIIILSLVFGPPYLGQNAVPFKETGRGTKTHKVHLKAGKFSYFHDFVTLDLKLFDTKIPDIKTKFDILLSVRAYHGVRERELYHLDRSNISLNFNSISHETKQLRLFSTGIVDFSDLDVQLIIKFHRNSHSGILICTYADTDRAVLDALIRLIFFIASVYFLMNLLNYDFSKTATPRVLKAIQEVDFILCFATQPLHLISYYTDSIILPVVDGVFAMLLIGSTAALLLLILRSSKIKEENTTQFLLPFQITSLTFVINDLYAIYRMKVDPLSSANNVSTFLSYCTFFFGAGILCYVFVNLIAFESEVKLEKVMLIVMTVATFAVAGFCQSQSVFEPCLASSQSVQTYAIAAVGTFVVFINYLYWPINPHLVDLVDDASSNL